ncbi:hypothetical protein EVG20_g1217 [Dentipellis fragilis]|uniref:Uncharacterized protein n=1 Tax=Dentipellis fragilis TaxID=205917 RepID=A0A4Y9ZEE8_9AGAM|nr:hypothetical protein EVG20_g1217 [Dentipellis fragilis]
MPSPSKPVFQRLRSSLGSATDARPLSSNPTQPSEEPNISPAPPQATERTSQAQLQQPTPRPPTQAIESKIGPTSATAAPPTRVPLAVSLVTRVRASVDEPWQVTKRVPVDPSIGSDKNFWTNPSPSNNAQASNAKKAALLSRARGSGATAPAAKETVAKYAAAVPKAAESAKRNAVVQKVHGAKRQTKSKSAAVEQTSTVEEQTPARSEHASRPEAPRARVQELEGDSLWDIDPSAPRREEKPRVRVGMLTNVRVERKSA